MVLYADISEAWNLEYKIPTVPQRFRKDTYPWDKPSPLDKPVEIADDPNVLDVPEPIQEVQPQEVQPQEVVAPIVHPSLNMDDTISSKYVNVQIKNDSICGKLKEYSPDYQSAYIESLIEEDLRSTPSDIDIFIKIIFVVLVIELIKILLYPLMRRD